MTPDEFVRDLFSLDQLRKCWAEQPHLQDRHWIDAMVNRVALDGIVEPLTERRFSSTHIDTSDPNYREGIICGGLCSRHRGVLSCLQSVGHVHTSPIIYTPEAITPFARLLSQTFALVTCSEYADNAEDRSKLEGVHIEDLSHLTFPSDHFDFVITNDVLEHVADIDDCLREIVRVMKPGGWHVGTHPFNLGSSESVKRAIVTHGGVEYLLPPEYHGNPVSSKGSLVFEVPGWDILARARAAGFSTAFMRALYSVRHGIFGADIAPVIVLMCQK